MSPLTVELDRLRSILNALTSRIRGVTNQPCGDLIDTEFLSRIIMEGRNDLKTKASQRITALGHMGCGKSTTLNLMLCSSIIDERGYRREWRLSFPSGFEETLPKVFTLQYFGESVSANVMH